VVAVYRLQIDGWNAAEAEAEMQSFGFNDIWMDLKGYVRSEGKTVGKVNGASSATK
jgi:hypothetical protein